MTACIVGVDPGVHRLGLAVCDVVSGEPLWCGSHPLDLPNGGHMYEQVGFALTYPSVLRGPNRAEPVIVAIEDPTHASRGKKQAAQWGAVMARVEDEARRRWPHIEFWSISPPGWKKAVGLAGNASRDAYLLWASSRLWDVGSTFGADPPDYDAAAAAGVATWAWLTNERGQVAA